jgi:hypothetical protein
MPAGGPKLNAGVAISPNTITQGQLVVHDGAGVTTTQLSSTSIPCSYVLLSAPTAQSTVAALNTGDLKVGGKSQADGGNASGGMTLAIADSKGFIFPINDANKVYITGFNSGDVVEYMIFS